MDLELIRRLTIIAMFSDDVLMEVLVLKGGNAISLVHKLGVRSSIDIDFSIEDDFSDLEDIKSRVFQALRTRFDSAGYRVFDESFERKPSILHEGQDPKWGGYRVEFKIIAQQKARSLGTGIEEWRRNAAVVSNTSTVFRVDISKFEYCQGKQRTEMDHFTVYVYTPQMIALEKLRAICQQMPGYGPRRKSSPRARDFYDIFSLITRGNLNMREPTNITLLQNIFLAKSVPVDLLLSIGNQRDFHEVDWPAVRLTVGEQLQPFAFYFEYVTRLAQDLHALGIK